MILLVKLTRFNVKLEIPFKIIIEACVVYDIHVTHPPSLKILYDIGQLPHEEPIPDTFLTPPECGQEPVYTLYDQVTGLPVSWARIDLDLMTIFIETNDYRDAGTYYLVLHVDTNGDSTAQPVKVVYMVTINACSNA